MSSETIDVFSHNIGRGKACDLCRQRKLRCDGVQPVCGRCMEARNKRINRMKQKGFDETQINQVTFPRCFDQDTTRIIQQDDVISRPSKHPRINSKEKEVDDADDNDLFFAEILSTQLPANAASSSKSTHEYLPTPFLSPADTFASLPRQNQPALRVNEAASLPPTAHLYKMINIYLETYTMHAVFQPQRLLERLAKGRGHEDYPQDAVLHMMLALAYVERPDLDETITEGPADKRKGAHYRHTLAAQQAIFEASHHGRSSRGYFDVTRALLMLCFKQYAFGDLWESFMTNGNVMRSCIALKLNKETPQLSEHEQHLLEQKLLPRITDGSVMQMKARDAIETEEMRRTMKFAFICDRNSSATTLWPNSIADEFYITPLPKTSLQEFLNGDVTEQIMNRPAKFLNSQDFFSLPAIDTEQLVFKGCVLMGRCAELVSKLPRDSTKEYLTSLSSFQRLESCITTLQHNNSTMAASLAGLSSNRNSMASFSQWLTKDIPHPRSDNFLISSTCTPYACTLILHEPFAIICQESEAACRGATRSIITIIRLCLANAEIEVLQSSQTLLIYMISLVGRSLIRQLESLYSRLITEEFKQDSSWNSQEFTDSASALQADVQVILLSLKNISYKWPIAMISHDTLLKLLQFNPEHRLRGLFTMDPSLL